MSFVYNSSDPIEATSDQLDALVQLLAPTHSAKVTRLEDGRLKLVVERNGTLGFGGEPEVISERWLKSLGQTGRFDRQ